MVGKCTEEEMLTIEIYANQAKKDSHNNPKKTFWGKDETNLSWAKKLAKKLGSQGAFRMKENVKPTPLKFNKMRKFEYKKKLKQLFSHNYC